MPGMQRGTEGSQEPIAAGDDPEGGDFPGHRDTQAM